jgi:hypothetical protein
MLTQPFPNAGRGGTRSQVRLEFEVTLGQNWVTGLTVSAMTVRQRIDELISDSIDEIEGRPAASRQPDAQLPAEDLTMEIGDLATQVRELTTQVGALVTIIRRLREE